MDISNLELIETLRREKDIPMKLAITRTLADPSFLEMLLLGLQEKDDTFRMNCYQVLTHVAKQNPQTLYPHWGYFAQMLTNKNAFYRAIAVTLIARLTKNDYQKRFDSLFDDYFALLHDTSVIPPRYIAQHAAMIIEHKPELQDQIEAQLLALDETHHQESRIWLIKGDALTSMAAHYETSNHQQEIIALAQELTTCSSPKARKASVTFLQEHGEVKT